MHLSLKYIHKYVCGGLTGVMDPSTNCYIICMEAQMKIINHPPVG